MKAITTKFHGPSNVKGSRYSATDGDGNRVILPTDYALGSERNHDRAAIALCMKMKWDGPLMGGTTKDGRAYTFDTHANRVRFESDFAQERRTAAIEKARAIARAAEGSTVNTSEVRNA